MDLSHISIMNCLWSLQLWQPGCNTQTTVIVFPLLVLLPISATAKLQLNLKPAADLSVPQVSTGCLSYKGSEGGGLRGAKYRVCVVQGQ